MIRNETSRIFVQRSIYIYIYIYIITEVLQIYVITNTTTILHAKNVLDETHYVVAAIFSFKKFKLQRQYTLKSYK